MVNVGRGQFGRMPTKGLGEVREMLRAKPRDSTNPIASRSCNMTSCIASLKQGKDMILVGRGQSVHCGNWGIVSARGLVFILQPNHSHMILLIIQKQV